MLLRLLSGPGPQRREKHSPAWTASPRTRVPRSDGAFRGRASEKPPALAVGSRHIERTVESIRDEEIILWEIEMQRAQWK